MALIPCRIHSLKDRLCSNCFSTGMVQPLCHINCNSCIFSSSNSTEPERTHPCLGSSWTAEAHRERQADINSHVIGPLNDITAENLGQRGEEERRGAGTMAFPSNMDTPVRISSREMEASCRAEAFSHFASFLSSCVRCIERLESFRQNLLMDTNIRATHTNMALLYWFATPRVFIPLHA